MPGFKPKFSISPKLAATLMRIEGARQAIQDLPITPSVLATLRETARLYSTHYSTMIEGNRLTQEEVAGVIGQQQHFPGRERDEKEVLGYYAALEKVEQLASSRTPVSERNIRTLHGLVMAEGRSKAGPTPYRDGQNVIRESRSRRIVYMPPEAKDVPALMKALVLWVAASQEDLLPCPLRAGIAHDQFATIHPYYDGNGRTARLLTTLILHSGGCNLSAYYRALTIGPSHNYYMGRVEADISGWVEYFCDGLAESFENVRRRAEAAEMRGEQDRSGALRRLDPRQRKALDLFRRSNFIVSSDLGELFGISQRASRNILAAWVQEGFVVVEDPARKTRKYGLGPDFRALLF